jgi:hypothetical protein
MNAAFSIGGSRKKASPLGPVATGSAGDINRCSFAERLVGHAALRNPSSNSYRAMAMSMVPAEDGARSLPNSIKFC